MPLNVRNFSLFFAHRTLSKNRLPSEWQSDSRPRELNRKFRCIGSRLPPRVVWSLSLSGSVHRSRSARREGLARGGRGSRDERSSAGNCSEHVPRTQKALRAASGALIEDRSTKHREIIRDAASRVPYAIPSSAPTSSSDCLFFLSKTRTSRNDRSCCERVENDLDDRAVHVASDVCWDRRHGTQWPYAWSLCISST